jgi:hypothetical protein
MATRGKQIGLRPGESNGDKEPYNNGDSNGRASAVTPFAYAKAAPVTLRTCPSGPSAPASFAAQSVVIRTDLKTRNEEYLRDPEKRKMAFGLAYRRKNQEEDQQHGRGIRRVALIQSADQNRPSAWWIG